MDELRFLRFLPGIVLGLVIGINADRFIWPHAVRLVAERIIRAIIRIKRVARRAAGREGRGGENAGNTGE